MAGFFFINIGKWPAGSGLRWVLNLRPVHQGGLENGPRSSESSRRSRTSLPFCFPASPTNPNTHTHTHTHRCGTVAICIQWPRPFIGVERPPPKKNDKKSENRNEQQVAGPPRLSGPVGPGLGGGRGNLLLMKLSVSLSC